MPKNLGLYDDELSTPRKKDVDNCYGPNNAPPYPVTSVSGKTGAVTLTKADVGLNNVDNVKQYSASNPPPYPVKSVNDKTGTVTLSKGDVGLSNVDNVKQYSESNPPPYPVTSVNKKTRAVVLDASDVNAVAKTGDSMTGTLTVGSASLETNGYVTGTWFKTTANTALSTKPSKIAVIDNGWIYSRTPAQIKNDIGLNNVDNIKQYSANNPPPYPVTSVNGQQGEVTVVKIVVSRETPNNMNDGDLWYQILS